MLSTLSSANFTHSLITALTFFLSVLLEAVLYNASNFLFITIKSLKIAGLTFLIFTGPIKDLGGFI